MRTLIAGAVLALATTAGAHATVKVEEVTYRDGNLVMKGLLAYDDAKKDKRPGLIVVHEWWGITKHIRDTIRSLAEKGYTALAVDMYGEGRTADHPKDAGALSGAVRKDLAGMQSRFNAGRALLAKHASVDAQRIGALGYCFGGSVVLEMARHGADLAGVASFHGGLATESPRATEGKVKTKVLVMNGAADPFVKADAIAAFKNEMESARVDYRFIDYPGAVHAFTNPEATAAGQKFKLPLAYDAAADRQSTEEMLRFFATLFHGQTR